MKGRVPGESGADDAAGLLGVLCRITTQLTAIHDPTLAQALAIALPELCHHGRWTAGHAWALEAPGRLTAVASWCAEASQRAAVDAASRLPAGEPARRAAATGVPHWGRGESALPVRGRRGVIAVIELLGGEQVAPGERLRSTADAVAALVGRIGERRLGLADAAVAPLPPPQHDGLRDALQTALRHGEFTLAYQPQVSLISDRVVAAEALLRWNRPEGVVSPVAFIPLAEETGDIVAIGEWVLRQACEQAAQWKRAFPGLRPWHVSVNVSPRQFDDGLVEVVRGALDQSGLDAASLRLEVTETTLIEDIELGRWVIVQLRGLGVSLALDDFGTGYSSLAYLRQLDLDEVKIDQAFVRGLGANVSDTAIVASVLSLAHALDRTVVAEGVETTGQLEHLRSLGCDLAQGFLFARPMPPDELALLLGGSARGVRLRPGTDEDREPALQTVLIVDDEPVIRQLARMCLTAGGFSIEEAGTGSNALAASRRSPPACVLLDMELPDSSGLEVCAALRQHPATAACTIVMLTSAAQNTTKAEAFGAGADDYIVKPFVPRDLCARVQAALRRRETG